MEVGIGKEPRQTGKKKIASKEEMQEGKIHVVVSCLYANPLPPAGNW